MTCYESVKVKDGAGNQSRARYSAVDWCCKNENYYIAGLIHFSDLCAIALYCASRRGIETLRATIILVCGRLFPILFTWRPMVFPPGMMRLPAALLALLRAGNNKRMGVDYMD